MNNLEMLESAPAVYSFNPENGVSKRYTFIRTIDVIYKLRDMGWQVVDAKQTGRKNSIYRKRTDSYARHMVVLEHPDYVSHENGVKVRLYVQNSHNRTRSFRIGIGFFVFICANETIVGEDYDETRIKHMDVNLGNIEEIVADTVKRFDVHYQKLSQYRQIQLTHNEKIEFAMNAIKARYGKEKPEINIEDILESRHEEYEDDTLWNVFNILQENLMRGGTKYKTQKGRHLKVRKVNSLNKEVQFNEQVWLLMEGLRTSKMC